MNQGCKFTIRGASLGVMQVGISIRCTVSRRIQDRHVGRSLLETVSSSVITVD